MDLKYCNIVNKNWLKAKHKQNLLFKTNKQTLIFQEIRKTKVWPQVTCVKCGETYILHLLDLGDQNTSPPDLTMMLIWPKIAATAIFLPMSNLQKTP